MAGSVGEALSQGIERGMGLGFQIQDRERQARLDEERRAAQASEQATAEQRYADAQARQQRVDQWQALNDERDELLAQVTGAQQAGTPIAPELAERITANAAARRAHRDTVLAPRLAQERQAALDLTSRIQAGEVDPQTLSGPDLYKYVSFATGRTPSQLVEAARGARMATQGLQTNNQGMTLQGVNQMLAPELRAGVGDESPYGGEIVRKEIVHLLPAQDANGQSYPDKVMPVVRVYVRHPKAMNDPTSGGITFYDAPLTENRSTDPEDKVKVVDLSRAFEYMGQLGSLAALLQNPAMQAKLAEGEKAIGAQTQADVDAAMALGYSRLKPEDRMLAALSKEDREAAARVKYGLDAKAVAPSAGVQSLTAKLEDIRARRDRGEITPEEAKRMENALTSGVRSATGLNYVDTGKLPEKPAGRGKAAGLGGAQPTPAASASDDPDTLVAAEWLAGKPPATKNGKLLDRYNAARMRLMKAAGLSLSDVIKQGEAYKIKAGAAQEIEKMYAAVESFSATVDKNMTMLEGLSKQLPRSDIPIISKGQLAVSSFVGNPTLSAYRGAMQSVATEVARIVTQPRLTGQLTDSARKEIQTFMHADMTHSQLMSLMRMLRTEVKNREDGIRTMRDTLADERFGNMAGKVEAAAGLGGAAPSKTSGGASVSNW